ncbi:MAG: extracellular solute-binding protein [Thermotogaceae bacterium]|nr:extracellular solute-binding protein [Thermotogaceae bacterium]
MKKLLTVAALFLIVAFSFSAIKVWFSWEGEDLFRSLAEEFEKETGIKVEVSYVRETEKKLMTTARASSKFLPDLVLIKSDNLMSVIDYLQPVSGDYLLRLSDKSKEAFTYEGRVYALPFYFDVGGVILYNKDIINIPANPTFEELVEIANNAGLKRGFLVPIYGTYFYLVFYRTFNHNRFVLDKNFTFKDEATRKTLNFYIKLFHEIKNLPLDRKGLTSAFMRGESGIVMIGSFMIPVMKEKNINVDIVDVPYIETAGEYLSANLDYKGFVVPRGKLSEEVKKFLEFLSRESIQEEFCRKMYKFPSNKVAFETLKSYDKMFEKIYEYSKYARPLPVTKLTAPFYEAVRTMLSGLTSGEENIEKLTDAAEKVINQWR